MPVKTIKIPGYESLQGEVVLEASASEDGPKKFSIDAYSGGIIRKTGGFPYNRVVDISGLNVPKGRVPVLSDHENKLEAALGHTESIELGDGILARGIFSGNNKATERTIGQLEQEMPLQASIGIRYKQGDARFVRPNQKVNVNGRDFEGPLVVVDRSTLEEISFCPLGADSDTSAQLLAASLQTLEIEEVDPTKEGTGDQSLKASSTDAEFEATLAAQREARAEQAAEMDKIQRLCAAAGNPTIEIDGEEVSLQAHAIANSWDIEKVELGLTRHTRQKAPAGHVHTAEATEEVLEASLAAQFIRDDEFLQANYDAKVLDQATGKFRNMSLGRAMHECILQAGASIHPGTSGQALVDAYDTHVLQAASGSTGHTLSGILSNVGHKRAEQAFQSVPTTFSQITSTASMSDFKTHTGYRLTSGMTYQKVGKEGELKTGPIHEDSYTNKLDTYGGRFQLTRQDIINDDLSMFDQLPRQIGIEAAATLEQATYEALVGASSGTGSGSFFTTNNGTKVKANRITSNGFGYDAITKAEQLFLDQIKDDGRPVLLTPSKLVVPTALKAEAQRLMRSANILPDSMEGDVNIHQGKFEIVCSPYLSAVTGGSATDWYLIADPNMEGLIEIGYLNGVTRPTIESTEGSFNILATQWRYYFDFGIALREKRAGVKNEA